MSIASAIATKQQQVAAAYTACNNKGGTLPATQNLTNLATCINSISSGQGGYAELPSYEVVDGQAKKSTYTLTGNEFSGITSAANNAFRYGFYYSNLGGELVFANLSVVPDYCFQNCFQMNNITSCDFGVTQAKIMSFASAFSQCSRLKTAYFKKLSSLEMLAFSTAFSYCTALENVYFNALTTTSFDNNTNQFRNLMIYTGTSVTHRLHFPSNLQSTISGLDGYPLFGGTSGYVVCAFDLPATS
jgi:hypothetical protein